VQDSCRLALAWESSFNSLSTKGIVVARLRPRAAHASRDVVTCRQS